MVPAASRLADHRSGGLSLSSRIGPALTTRESLQQIRYAIEKLAALLEGWNYTAHEGRQKLAMDVAKCFTATYVQQVMPRNRIMTGEQIRGTKATRDPHTPKRKRPAVTNTPQTPSRSRHGDREQSPDDIFVVDTPSHGKCPP